MGGGKPRAWAGDVAPSWDGSGRWCSAAFGVGFPGFTPTFPPVPHGVGRGGGVAVGGGPGAVDLSWAACPSLPCGHDHCCL